MQKNNSILLKSLLILVMFMSSVSLYAQFNGGNVSSPYSMFGIGDMRVSGTAITRSMGGGGLSYRDAVSANVLNPASLSAAPRQSFYFAIGAEGVNSYLSSKDKSTSNNSVNLGFLAVRMPVAKGLGFSFSMSPYSSVGYSIREVDNRDEIIGTIGDVNYLYTGKGDIGQYKIGMGWEIFKNFSFGANFIYYLGNLNRKVTVETNPYVSNISYSTVHSEENQHYSIPSVELGLQYGIRLNDESILNLAAVYQPGIKNNTEINYIKTSYSGNGIDTLYNNQVQQGVVIPDKYAGGLSFQNSKLLVYGDYTFEKFSKSFSGNMLDEKVDFVDRNTIVVGAQFTPNRYDIRYLHRRMSYRVGFRYTNSYMKYNGNPLNEYAVSAGVGIPFNSVAFSSINIGLEYCIRGSKSNDMIRTNLFSFFVDLNLFTDQQWFRRFKFD